MRFHLFPLFWAETLELARRVSHTDATILVLGESGSGKEVLARAIHQYSPRNANPWVDISCAVFPENLIESELFGYEKGAFSGAQMRKPGMFELADTGTLFLDEIGELDLRLQVKLLRVLDNGEYFCLGGTRKTKVNVRIVAATNRNLLMAVEEGHFRRDLYHRLAQVKIEVPPLRERPEDILPIAKLFLKKYRPGSHFSPEAEQALTGYAWHGNVRELRNAVISSMALSPGCEIGVASLPPEILAATPRRSSGDLLDLAHAVGSPRRRAGTQGKQDRALAVQERNSILKTLAETNGHQEEAAQILGISARTLSRRLKQYRRTDGMRELTPVYESQE